VDQWINLTAIWQILWVGMLAGAGLPALVALGLWALSMPRAGSDDSTATVGTSPVGMALAVSCFTIVLTAIGYGIYLIVISGH
jgi:hypothetical protein